MQKFLDMKQKLPSVYVSCLAVAAVFAATSAHSAVFSKANNTQALNLAASWTNNAVPGVSDIAQWDNNVTALNTTNALGANLSWGGIKIVNPGSTVNIGAGNTVTNGASGIDMTGATADLVLSNTVFIAPGALQKWNVASGRTLNVSAVPTKPGQPSNNTGALQVGTTGTVKMGTVASATIYDNQNNSWVTYGQNDWAALDGSGNVIAATYTASTASALTAGVYNDIVTDVSGGTGSAVDVPGIRFNDSTFHTLNIANSGTSRTLTCRGILVTANCAGGLISGSATTSFIRPNRVTIANTGWNVIQNSPNDFTIGVNIANGSSSAPTHLVKSGPGNLIIGLRSDGAQAGTGSGGMDVNEGTLTIAAGASTGSGAVTVNGGRFVVIASNTTFVSSITVNSGATNSIKINQANGQQITSAVTFNSGVTRCEFNYGSGIAPSTTTAPLLATNVIANGTITVDIFNSAMTTGVFPLIKYPTSLTGTGFGAFALGFLPPRVQGYLSNDTVNSSISLVVTNVSQPIHWAVGNGTWDINTTANWANALGSTTYQQSTTPYSSLGDKVLFDDSASGSSPITVDLNTAVAPSSVVVSNSTKAYTISSTSGNGNMGGIGSLTKSGNSTLTLGLTNSFSGGLNLNGGIVNFTSISNLGTGAITFGGGALQYASGNVDDISTRTVNFGAGGATIDDGGNAVTFTKPVGNGGVGGLTKTGAGTLTLNGTNKYTGNTVVSQGTLALGASTYISNSPAIIVNGGAILDTVSSGVGLTLSTAASQILAGVGTVNGTVTVGTGTTVTPATNGVYGTLTLANDLIVSGGALTMDVSTNNHDRIAVGGSVTINSGSLIVLNASTPLTNGVYQLITYTGVLSGGAGSVGNLTVVYSQPGKAVTLDGSISGEIDLIVADTASDTVTWSGAGSSWDLTGSANWFIAGSTPWAYTNGDTVIFDNSGVAQATVNLMASLNPSSVVVSNDAASYDFVDGTFTGGGKLAGATGITKKGSGTLILETANINTGPTVINAGTIQVGNGGALGDLGAGNITNNGALAFNQNNNHSVSGVISGTGNVIQQGSGTVTLSANNTYTGPTTITSGGLQVGTGGAAGSLGSGAITNDGTLIYNRSGTLTVGNIHAGPANQGALSFTGPASVTLNNGNTYINNTTINNGVVKITSADAIPSAATLPGSTGWLVLDGGAAAAGVLDVNGLNISVNALSGLGNTVNGMITNSGPSTTTTNMLTVLGSAATTYSGAISENTAGSKLALTLLGASELRLAGNCSYSGPTLVASGATLGAGAGYVSGSGLTILSNNATFYLDANSPSVSVANSIFIPDNSTASITSRNAANTMGTGSSVSGGPTATNVIGGTTTVSFGVNSTKQFQNLTGTVVVASGATLRFSSTSLSVNGGDNATFDVEGTLRTRNGTGSGAGISLGALTGTGTVSGEGEANGNTAYVIGAKGIDTVFSGTIADGSPSFTGNTSITKTGSGRLTLDGTLSYTGATAINNGVLALGSLANSGVSLDTSASITMSSNAVLDVSARSDSALNLGNSIAQTLTGSGTIRGSLNQAANSTVNVGYGTLIITNVATLNGPLILQLNRTNGVVTNSTLAAASFVISAPLTVTNLGPALQGGDTFQLFNTAVTGFTATNLPVLTGNLYWTNKLALNGSIAVVNPVATNPTNITVSVSGSSMTLSWPADHLGWTLQTNATSLADTNAWFAYPGSTATTSVSLPIDATKTNVFFRLKY